jgi:ribosome maturation factor RimP
MTDQNQLYRKLRELIEPTVHSMGLRLWGLDVPATLKGGVLRVYIDSDEGVTIDQCAELSKHLNVILDMEDMIPGPYTLEVSSPGLERPFFTLDQLAPYMGRTLTVKLKEPLQGSRKWRGRLEAVGEGTITIQTQEQRVVIPWEQVHKANLVYES